MRRLSAIVLLLGCTGEQPAAPISLADDFVLLSDEDVHYPRRYGPDVPDKRVVYLNFEGGPLYCGARDDATADVSAIICNLTYPPFVADGYRCDTREECIEEITRLVREKWKDFAIEFVTERPEEGDYDMAMIGGTVTGGAAGVSTLDCPDRWGDNVVFAFSGVVGGAGECSRSMLATVITHELAHSMGVCHNDDCSPPVSSVMCPQLVACQTDWGPGCQVDACPCYAGCADPHELLMEVLGPSETNPPEIDIVSPPDGDIPCEDLTIFVDVTDETQVDEVFLFEGGRKLDWLNVPPFTFTILRPTREEHTYRIVAYDSIGNRAEATVTVNVACSADCIVGSCCCGKGCCQEICDCIDRTPTGGACEEDDECRGGLCISLQDYPGEGKVCSEMCSSDGTCPAGFLCIEEDGAMLCREDVWADTGAPCETGADCLTGNCALTDEDMGECTIPCVPEDSGACPEGSVCRSLADGEEGGEALCLSPVSAAKGGGGCSVAGSAGFPAGWLVLLALGFALRRLRRS